MPLDLQGTTLAQSPYYDDYDETKNFHRVLFKPSVAVQARELTQLQTILQNQIERFGDNVYRIGTIINGCALTTDANYYYVKLNDVQTTGEIYTISALSNTYAIETSTGLQSVVVNYATGGQQLAPDMNTLYLKYLNTGTGGQKTYSPDSILKIYDRNYAIQSVVIATAGSGYSNNDTVVFTSATGSGAVARIVTSSTGAILRVELTNGGSNYTTAPTVSITTSTGSSGVLTALNYIAQVRVANTSYGTAGGYSSDTVGVGTAIKTSEGVIYQKGHFVRVDPHEVILSKYDTTANNVAVGFVTNEAVVNSNSDQTLLDNAGGTSNFTAPGADRLKLTANLTVYTSAAAAAANGFLSLYEYQDGKVIKDRTVTQFNSVTKELSRRTFEESGNYVVDPFTVYSEGITGNTTHVDIVVQPGIAYVEGNRVEILNNTRYPIAKGTAFTTSSPQTIATAYGGFIYVKELVIGSTTFDITQGAQIQLWSAARQSITTNVGSGATGIQIGTARVRSLVYDSGTPGSPDCVYRMYIFDVRMTSANFSFKDVRCAVIGSGYPSGSQADLIVDPSLGYTVQYDSEFDRMMFPTGTFAVKDFTNEILSIRTSTATSIALTGTATVALSGNATLGYSTGALNSIQERDFIVIPQANIALAANLTGTIATNTNTTLTGTGTRFSTEYNVGDYVKVGSDTLLITAITSNTTMTVSTAASGSVSGQGHTVGFRQGVPINFAPSGRSITIDSPTQFTISLGGATAAAANVAVYYDYTFGITQEATVRTKAVDTYYVKISNTSVAASTNGPWSLGLPDAVELVGVYKGTGSTYPANTTTNYASQFLLDSGQTDNYYGLASLKKRPGAALSLGINDNLLVQFKAFRSQPGYYYSSESYSAAIDDASSTLPANRIRTYQIPMYVSPKTGQRYDLRDTIDFRPQAANTTAYATTPAAAPNTSPSSTVTFDTSDKRFPSPTKSFTANISSFLSRKDRLVIDKYGQVNVVSGLPANSPSAPIEPEGTMTLAVVNIPQFPSLGAIEASVAGRPDLAVLATPTQNRRFTMKDIGDIESRISRLEYYSLLNTLETQTKQLVLPGESNTSIERFKNGFFVDPLTDYNVSNLADTEYKMLIDTNKGIGRPYFYDTKVNLQLSGSSSNVVQKGDVVVLGHTEKVLLQQPVATRYRTLVDKLWAYVGNLRTFPEFDNWHDTETRDTVITIDIYSPIADLAAATSSALSNLSGSSVLVRGPQDVGGAFQISGGDFGDQVWQQNTESLYKDTKVTLKGGASTTTTTTVGSFVNDISVQQFIRSQRIYFLATGLRPGATHFVFFENDLMTSKVAPHSVPLTTTTFTRDSFAQLGAVGAPLVANSMGCVAGSIDIPASTYFIGERSVVIMDIDNTASESSATSKAIGRFSAFGISTYSTNLSISTKTVDTAGGRGYGAQTYFSDTYAVAGERYFNRSVPWPDPLSQTFLIQPQTTTSDGIYLTSIDLFFQAKDPVQGVTVEIRETLNGVPTQSVLPFSRKYLTSGAVSVSNNGSSATTFTFDSPVYVRTNVDYAIVVYPDANSPEYRVFTSQTGQKDLVNTNTYSNQNWGLGTLFYSTSGSAWTPVQDEDLKFTLRRAQFNASSGTAILNNGDYEFFTIQSASGLLRGGEDVAQLQPSNYINTRPTTNSTSAVVTTNSDLTATLSAGDRVMLVYGVAGGTPPNNSNVSISGTTVANAAAGDNNTNFTTRYSRGSFVRFGNSTVGEIRQVVSVSNNSLMTIDAPINGTATNIQQHQITPSYQVARVVAANTTSITLNKVARLTTTVATHTGTTVTMQKTVAGVVDTFNYSNNTVYLSGSTSSNSSNKYLTSNTTYCGTIVGDTSQATAEVVSIDDMDVNYFTPLFSKVVVGGTSLGLDGTVIKSTSGSTDTRSYQLGVVNKFEFNDTAKIKSKTNEIVGSVVNKSFQVSVSFSAPTTGDDTSPMLDINPIGVIVTKNVIGDDTTEIVYDGATGGTGVFNVGETVVQVATGAQGIITSLTTSVMVLDNVIGKFMPRAAATIQGVTSATTATVKQVFDETTRFGKGKSKYISKRLSLAEGMDAEDVKLFITAYKPLGTDIDVYAKVLNFTDGQAFEEKDWTLLDLVTNAGVYSDSYNDEDYREFEYTFPYSPPSVRETGIVATSSGSNTITGTDTLFSSEFAAGDLIKVVRTNSLSDYEVLRVQAVASNTSMTTTTASGISMTGGTIELITQPRAAFKYNKNSSIVRYHDSTGAAYDTYKYLAIKVVLRSPYTYLVPTLNDVRALAVSI